MLRRLYPNDPLARCTVERRMRALGLARVSNARSTTTTRQPKTASYPGDLVKRDFTADTPDTRWVADITYVPTWSGFVYVAFVMDLFSRMIVGLASRYDFADRFGTGCSGARAMGKEAKEQEHRPVNSSF